MQYSDSFADIQIESYLSCGFPHENLLSNLGTARGAVTEIALDLGLNAVRRLKNYKHQGAAQIYLWQLLGIYNLRDAISKPKSQGKNSSAGSAPPDGVSLQLDFRTKVWQKNQKPRLWHNFNY